MHASEENRGRGGSLEDVLAPGPLERLLEDSWDERRRRPGRRELLVEAAAGLLFLAVAIPLARPALAAGRLPAGLAVVLIALYAIAARTIRFPLGAGYVVPSYLVLVPMLLLLPPLTVPLLTAAALLLGTAGRLVAGSGRREELLFAVPDAWHTLGPALVLAAAGPVHGPARIAVFVAAFLAGCLIDLVISTLREALAHGVAPRLQVRVIAMVWLLDACLAPLGLLFAEGARAHPSRLLLLLPLNLLLMLIDRDRTRRIAEAHRRLGLVARERTRLQAAVHRLADAFAAKLDLRALAGVVMHGLIDALDADGGQLILRPPGAGEVAELAAEHPLRPLLAAATESAARLRHTRQIESGGVWALAVPLTLGETSAGAVSVARGERPFTADERELMQGLVARAERTAEEILGHEALREQVVTDPLTRLGNRRKLADDLSARLANASRADPLLLMLFDLDGFKGYNDTFGHVAGDALLARLGHKLAAAVTPEGTAYRLGGDEFCVLLPAHRGGLTEAVAAAAGALQEHGETFSISASCGSVLLPHEAGSAEYALQLADERMYTRKQGRASGAREQAQDVLVHIMQAGSLTLPEPTGGVARLAARVGRRLGLSGQSLDELARAAALHDVGKVGIPEAILSKPGPLDAEEWGFVRQHTLLGERILSAAPALRPVATIVRATHERWDGTGYPDGLAGEAIPAAARIIAACDAYFAMTTDRCYRPARSAQDAREILRREAGRQFDPAVVRAVLEEFEAGDREAASGGVLTALPPHATREALARSAAEVVSRVNELLERAA